MCTLGSNRSALFIDNHVRDNPKKTHVVGNLHPRGQGPEAAAPRRAQRPWASASQSVWSDAHCGPRGSQNGHSDVNARPRGEFLGALNSNRSDLSIDNHVREKPRNSFSTEICNPGVRGLGPQPTRLPGPGPGQMDRVPFLHLLVINV